MEDISHAHIVSLIYKLITSSKDSDNLFIGFDRSRNRRKDELAQNKNVKVKFNLRIMLKDIFGSAQCQEKATYCLGYKLTLRRINDDAVIDKVGGFTDARKEFDHMHCFILHFTPSIQD